MNSRSLRGGGIRYFRWGLSSLLLLSSSAFAGNYTFTLQDLKTAMANGQNGSEIHKIIVQRIQQELNNSRLLPPAGGYLFGYPIDEEIKLIPGGCAWHYKPWRYKVNATRADITLSNNSNFTIYTNELRNGRLTISANVSGFVKTPWTRTEVNYKVYKIRNLKKKCRYGHLERGDIRASARFSSSLVMDINFKLSTDTTNKKLIIEKSAVIRPPRFKIHSFDVDTRGFGSVSVTRLSLALFDGLKGISINGNSITGSVSNRAQDSFNRKVLGLNNKLKLSFNQPSSFNLPSEEFNLQTIKEVMDEFQIPQVLSDMVKKDPKGLLLALLEKDSIRRKLLLAQLGSDLACGVIRRYERWLPLQTAFRTYSSTTGTRCISANQTGSDLGNYFSNSSCTTPLAYRPAPKEEQCAVRFSNVSKPILGNAASWTPDVGQANDPIPSIASRKWTALPSSKLNIGVVSNSGAKMPLTKVANYKTITGLKRGNGTCKLEMRVYTDDVNAKQRKPLLAIHGGQWRSRGFSFTGLEATVSQFTKRGFVVFAPFYRLTGTVDGNVECNNASWREAVEDVQDALKWVKSHGKAFGANTSGRISVFGQSAGAHLATYLSIHQPLDIEKNLAFYSPMDVLDFLVNAVPGGQYEQDYGEFGYKVFTNLFGSKKELAEVNIKVVDVSGIDPKSPPTSLVDRIPDAVFNLSQMDMYNPSPYVARCGKITGTNLPGINPLAPPAPLMSCLKNELSEFILNNSFSHLVTAKTPPTYMIIGMSDQLIPYKNLVTYCDAQNTGLPGIDASTTTVSSTHSCGKHSTLVLIKEADHMLDLGVCAGPVCPAGKTTAARNATRTAIVAGQNWLVQPDPSTR